MRLISELRNSVQESSLIKEIPTREEWVNELTPGTIGMQNGTTAWYHFDGDVVHRLRKRNGKIISTSTVSKEELKELIPRGEKRYITTVSNINGLPTEVIGVGQKHTAVFFKKIGGLKTFDEGLI